MVYVIEQNAKELFAANFTIYSKDLTIGMVDVIGSPLSPESKIQISINNSLIEMARIQSIDYKLAYRPYTICMNKANRGYIFQTEKKKSFFSSYGYIKAKIDEIEYFMYPIGFGKDGTKNPIYCQNEQIGLLKKDNEIINGLYHFNLVVDKESNLIFSLIFTFYVYAKSFFKPGMKQNQYKRTGITKTIEKELLKMYNPEFEMIYGV